ncbi:MAG TPA: DUF983 domain-containing protein [Planctomycetota bacterium]|nr:DUF983 domain-containing protein [Planctomycetota bacterium]
MKKARGLLAQALLALRLRCPACGRGDPFIGLLELRHHCPACGYRFVRESGYFVGSIYFNYAATAGLEISGYFALEYALELTFTQQVPIWLVFSVLFPIWFLRYARSLWMALDVTLSPPVEQDFVVRTGP